MEGTGGFCSSLGWTVEPSPTPAPSEPEVFTLHEQILSSPRTYLNAFSVTDWQCVDKTKNTIVTSQIFIIQSIKLLQIDLCHYTLDINYPPVQTVAVKLLISSSISLHRMLPRILQNVYFISKILNMIVCRFIVSSNKLMLTVVLSLKSNCALYWTINTAACSYGPTKGSLKCLIILLPNTKTSQSFLFCIICFNQTLIYCGRNEHEHETSDMWPGGNLQDSLPSGGCGKLLTDGLRSISTLGTFFMFKSSKKHMENKVGLQNH